MPTFGVVVASAAFVDEGAPVDAPPPPPPRFVEEVMVVVELIESV